MIYRMASDVVARMRAKKFPVTLEYGRVRIDGSGVALASHTIEFSRDTSKGDRVEGPLGSRPTSGTEWRVLAKRGIGVTAKVYARSAKAGARLEEHEHLCDALVDGLVSALIWWSVEGKAGPIEWREARYLTAAELGSEQTAGVVYLLSFAIGRGVYDRPFDGSFAPTGAATDVSSSLKIRAAGGTEESVPPTPPEE